MELKSFIAGLVCGGAAFVVVDALVLEGSKQTSLPAKNAESALTTGDGKRVSAEQPSEPVGSPAAAALTSETQSQSDRRTDVGSLEAGIKQELTAQNWFDQRRSRLDREPRDDRWSPFSEQALRQFWGTHKAASELSLQYIECSATTCQVAVTGVDERAHATLLGMLYDLRQEPWYEFGQTGTSAGNVGGRFMLVAELHRAQRGDE